MVGDRHTIEAVYQEIGSRLWRSLLGYSGDADIASDAMAEAFAQALVRDGELRYPEAWVWRAAFRIAAGMLKERSTRALTDAEDDYHLPEPVADLVRALSGISERQRLAVVLHDYADRPTAEVAKILGVTTATVYVHLSQGRRRLRELLEVDDA